MDRSRIADGIFPRPPLVRQLDPTVHLVSNQLLAILP